jgi:hypothetical protein
MKFSTCGWAPGALLARIMALLIVAITLCAICASAARAQAPNAGAQQPLRANPEAAMALQDRFDEFMRVLNGDFDRLKPELFSAAFREELPLGKFGDAIKEQYANLRGFKLLGANPVNPYRMNAWLRSVSDGKDWDMTLGIETQKPYAIDSLAIQARPVKALRPFDGWALLDRDLESLIERSGFALYEIMPDGSLAPVHRVQGNRRMAIGIASQIWILGALAEKVAAGEARWDQKLALERAFKSLPPVGFGVTPDGFEFGLNEFAERLMAHQDTTAFDHLLNFLGRSTVEALKNSDREGPDGPGSVIGAAASPDDPFLSTLDLYRLTCTVDATVIKRYAEESAEGRRTMLETVLPKIEVMFELFEVWAKPQEIERVGWFATADELCRAAARIWRIGREPGMRAATLDVMEVPDNPTIDRSLFKYVGASTGGVPGAFAGTWIYERVDGRVFVMTFIFNNPNNLLETQRITPIIEASQALVGHMKDQPAK